VLKFDFRLARVLRLREATLRTEQFALQQARVRLAELQAELEALKRSVENAGRQVKAETWVRPEELANLQHYAKRVERESKEWLTRIAAQDDIVLKQQTLVLDAQRKVRLLEKLREKKRAEWKIEADREDNKTTDDFLAAQWVRRRDQAG
jgi:flagellar protein FliJ